jgi:transposase
MILGMYWRETKRKNKDGSVVEYCQLAHNVWNANKGYATAQIVHNFGRKDELDVDGLKRLCRSIARVCGLQVNEPGASDDGRGGALQDVLAPGVRQILTRPLGAALAIRELWERQGIGPALREIQAKARCTVPYEAALFMMTANRLCEPSSKLGTWDTWRQKVHLPECESLKLEQLYAAMDLLHDHAAELEERVFFQTADLLNLEVDVVFYDTTTCSFSIDVDDEDEEDPRVYGRPKEGGWTPQVIVALAVTREGIPVRSWVFPGNTSDVSTVRQVKEDLRGWKLGRALFVGDGGMDSQDNRKELLRGCGHYLLAVRAASLKEVRADVLRRAGRYREIAENLKAKEVVVGEGELRRRYIVCFNPREAERQRKHREKVLAFLETELASHRSLDAGQKWAIELLASGRYGRYLTVGRGRKLAIDRQAVRDAEFMDGKWVLITSDDTLSIDDAATGYKALLVIERCFRALKSTGIKLEPVHHWRARRIEAHVKICVLALLIQRVAEILAGQPWARIREQLDQLQATEYHTISHRFFRTNQLMDVTANLLQKLKIKPPRQVLGIAERAE